MILRGWLLPILLANKVVSFRDGTWAARIGAEELPNIVSVLVSISDLKLSFKKVKIVNIKTDLSYITF